MTSPAMLAALDAHESGGQSFDLLELVECYAADYQPHATNGFEPGDAEKRWCGVLGYTFLGLAYEREYVDRGDIHRFMDRRENNVTLNFSNVSREMAVWVQQNEIEGKQVVIRVVSRASSATLEDSLVIFTGRLDNPGDFSDTSCSLTATQRFGRRNQEFPPRTFSPNDSLGRAPNDPEFQGFRFTAQTATVIWTTRVRRQGFGGLVGLTKKVTHSFQASSHSEATADLAVPDAFGRVQLYGTYLGSIDIGGAINVVVAVCEGGEEGIDDFIAVKQVNPKFSQVNGLRLRYGYRGGEGVGARAQVPVKQTNPGDNIPADGYYSFLSWFHGFVTGSTPDVDEAEAPDWMILVKAKRVKVPDGSGAFPSRAWTDVPAYIARHLLADARYFNEGESAIEDSVCYETGQYNAGYVLDSSKGEWVFIPETDADLHGVDFSRFRSTGLIDSRRVRMNDLGTLSGDPHLTLAEIEPFDPIDPPQPFDPPSNPNLRQTVLRQRHTCNVTLLERMSGLNFLYNVVAPTGRLFFRRNGRGKIDILTEKPADNTRLRAAVSPGATALPVTDVDPWKSGLLLTQKLLVGNTFTTSEVRVVTAAAYTADGDTITLAASSSGGVTVAVSGATLAGGSSSTPASGTVTLGGSAGSGVTLTVTINGIACAYTLDAYDSLASAALLLARFINATPRLAQFVKASASGSVVTVTAKWGELTLNVALANSHAAEVASPTAAPTASASAGGVLPAGTYYVAYSRRTAVGTTALSPAVAVTVAANQKIVTGAVTPLPSGVTSVDWFVSTYANSTELVYYGNNDGLAFTIGQADMPDSSAALPPDMNTTGEELVRVAMSFASNDQGADVLAQTGLTRGSIHKGSFKWPLSGKQTSTNVVTGTFYDATEDYQPTPLEVRDYAHIAQIRKENKKEVDLSGFDNYSQASRHLNFILSKNREGDWYNTLSTGPQAMLLEEGDVICSSSDNGGLVNVVTRAEEISIGKAPTYTTRVTGRKYSTLMFSDQVRQHTIRLPTTHRHVTPLETLWEFIDLPAVRPGDANRSAFYLVPTFDQDARGSWKGWQLWADFGAGYSKLAEGDVAGTTGTVSSTLSAGDPDTYYPSATLTVVLKNGTPTSLTQSDLEADPLANLAVWGSEYLQFAAAVETDPATHTWTLTGLYRGRLGTIPAAHSAGDRFALMDARQIVELPVSLLNTPGDYKMLTVNQSLGDVSAVSKTWTGGTLRYPPPGVQASRDASTGDWRLRFFGQVTTDPAGELYKAEIVGGRTFDNLRGAESRRVSLSTVSVISDDPPPPGKGSYRAADAPGNSVTAASRYVIQMIQGERAVLSATFRTTLDETSVAAGNDSTLTFSSGALQSLTMTVTAETSTEAAQLTISDNLLSTVFTDAAGEATGTRYSVEFSDGKVKFFRNRGAQSEPFYVHTPPNYEVEFPGQGVSLFPSEVQVNAGTGCTWADIELDEPGAAVVYTAAEQEADGFTLPLTSITVRASQQRVVQGVVVDGMVTEVTFP